MLVRFDRDFPLRFYYFFYFTPDYISAAEIGNDSGSRMRLENHRFSPWSLVTSRTLVLYLGYYTYICIYIYIVPTNATTYMHTYTYTYIRTYACHTPNPCFCHSTAVILIIRTAVKIYRSMGTSREPADH